LRLRPAALERRDETRNPLAFVHKKSYSGRSEAMGKATRAFEAKAK
jgi:hypothetical protein